MGTLNDLLQGTSKGFWAGGAGAPVDTLTLALNALIAGGGYAGHKLGLLDTPPSLIEKPVGGSEWIADKMREGGLLNDNPGSTADNWGNVIGGLLGPITAAKAPQIARGLLRNGPQLAASRDNPLTIQQQRGMIRIPGRGQIPETRSDIDRLSNRLGGLLDDANIDYSADKSSISPAKYFIFDKPGQSADDIAKYGAEKLKVRISDHENIHGADFSVDPKTGVTFEEMLQGLRNEGVLIGNRVKPIKSGVVPDDFIEKFFGRSIKDIQPDFLEQIRKNYVLDRRGGYWKDKRAP